MTENNIVDVVAGVDLSGKSCVITGASSGLGRSAAKALASIGAHVVLAARNADALSDADRYVHTEVPDADTSVVVVDLASLASVHRAAETIQGIAPAIHVLMNNAGVMFTPPGRTADGFETQFGTNHLGHFELTRLLAPQLIAAEGARVVILSSDGHRMSDVDLDDPNWEHRDYDKFAAYGASKTANILHMVELDRRLADHGVRAYSVHPGVVATSLARHMHREDFTTLMKFEAADPMDQKIDVRHDFTLPDQGAVTQVWAAVDPALSAIGSVYLSDCRVCNPAPYALDGDRALLLWELSERLCAAVTS